jgi:hypothetical protein
MSRAHHFSIAEPWRPAYPFADGTPDKDRRVYKGNPWEYVACFLAVRCTETLAAASLLIAYLSGVDTTALGLALAGLSLCSIVLHLGEVRGRRPEYILGPRTPAEAERSLSPGRAPD